MWKIKIAKSASSKPQPDPSAAEIAGLEYEAAVGTSTGYYWSRPASRYVLADLQKVKVIARCAYWQAATESHQAGMDAVAELIGHGWTPGDEISIMDYAQDPEPYHYAQDPEPPPAYQARPSHTCPTHDDCLTCHPHIRTAPLD